MMAPKQIDDKPKDECGVFGIYAPLEDVSRLTYYGLLALQHRGQESAGIAAADGKSLQLHKGMGLVTDVFTKEKLADLKGDFAIGHVRYSTTGQSTLANAQPLLSSSSTPNIALAHNGNLVNSFKLRKRLATKGVKFETTSDSEVILKLLTGTEAQFSPELLAQVFTQVQGAYSVLVLTENQLVGARDPHGVRPLCLGKLKRGSYVLASESCALDTIGAQLIRDIKPGEIIQITQKGLRSINISAEQQRLCVFEYIYLARQDSKIDNQLVNEVRRSFGKQLAREVNIDVDLVIAVPESGITAALGFAEEKQLPFREGLAKNRYLGRTFIQPNQRQREREVQLKLNPVPGLLAGKKVAIVDDSIVRGTTCCQIVKMLRKAGAKEVHFLVSSPPLRYPCYYGVDVSSQQQLIAARKSISEIKNHIGADSLHYLSVEGMLLALKDNGHRVCKACFNGEYPITIPDTLSC
ncbi:amidophosphoribosyltransferase [Bacillota bacterium LX-D]|nr:amidophosphoribosyltransferase [Bacillota bacterium LX-D]